jgi:hypothetical protein
LKRKNAVKAKVVTGHGIASGKNYDPRFPNGTLAMQYPFFTRSDLKLSRFHQGTINLDIAPYSFQLLSPTFSFPKVKWSPDLPAENFSFYACTIAENMDSAEHNAYVYWPHPSTKPDFHQSPDVLEILSPKLSFISYGSSVILRASEQDILFLFKKV